MGLVDAIFDSREMGLIVAFINAIRDSGRNVAMHLDGAVSVDDETWTADEFKKLARRWESGKESLDVIFGEKEDEDGDEDDDEEDEE